MIDPNNMELELVTPLPVIHIQRGTYVDGQMDPGLDWDLEFGLVQVVWHPVSNWPLKMSLHKTLLSSNKTQVWKQV